MVECWITHVLSNVPAWITSGNGVLWDGSELMAYARQCEPEEFGGSAGGVGGEVGMWRYVWGPVVMGVASVGIWKTLQGGG